jgi:hypothetical protein
MNGDEDELEDQSAMMLFGALFKLYTRISDKVVGILLRARKYGLVHFEPEILFQVKDDTAAIILDGVKISDGDKPGSARLRLEPKFFIIA